jgi:hemoglobin
VDGEGDETDIFEAVGGEKPFLELVDAFYQGVESDPPLRALYPDDLGPGKNHLAWFLIQRFGGPNHFNERRGAPRLRMRHAPFAITAELAARWVAQMTAAVDATPAFALHRPIMLRYFQDAALFLVNREPHERLAVSLPVATSGGKAAD